MLVSILKRARIKARPSSGAAIAGAVILSIAIACLNDMVACMVSLALGASILIISGSGLQPLRFAAVNAFILFMWLFVPWTIPGPVLWRWGWLSISNPGVQLCFVITLKANAILAVFMALVAPMSVSSLARGLASLHCPAKLSWMLLLMVRNVHLLKREWRKLTEAAKLRGFIPRASFNAYKSLAAMLAILLARADDRGRKLHEAMLLACFDGQLPFHPQKGIRGADAVFIIFIISSCACLVYINYA